MNKKKMVDKSSKITIIKVILVLLLLLFVLALKFKYIHIKNFSFEKAKLYFQRDEKLYADLVKWVKDFLQPLSFDKPTSMDGRQKNQSSLLYIYPVDGQVQLSEDGGYFIVVKKKTNVLSPCDGKIVEIIKKGETFDVVIQESGKVLYRIENINVLNVQKGEVLKKGEIIGYKLPFDLVEEDFIYFKREEMI
ncbi:M23 family metallopeptidase [Anaerocellum danielii]|uniref:M23 family metallopeptidase n=1 Tax=Anaerocellum danielii TaxID=1387557 RepID=A0ABZ0U1K3_9FIRM|nr:M23 family metallopeptidase [Caldicellulosiruptor danielii]WPX09565.1 M23 family metallopeptidase [Caldicellulosiruptor danielii]